MNRFWGRMFFCRALFCHAVLALVFASGICHAQSPRSAEPDEGGIGGTGHSLQSGERPDRVDRPDMPERIEKIEPIDVPSPSDTLDHEGATPTDLPDKDHQPSGQH